MATHNPDYVEKNMSNRAKMDWEKRSEAHKGIFRNAYVSTIAAGVLCLLLIISLTSNLTKPDFFNVINFGRQFWMEGGLPQQDIYSYLPTRQPLVFHEWLTGVLFYLVYTQWGAAPLQVIKYACGLLAAFFAWRAARDRGASRAGVLTALFLAGYVWAYGFPTVLARDFSGLFFAMVIATIESYRSGRRGRRVILSLVVFFVLWANLHGGFIVGIAVLGIYAVNETRPGRPFLFFWGLLAAGVMATLINPYGWRLWSTVLSHGMSPDPESLEWLSIPNAVRMQGWTPEIALTVMLAGVTVPLVLLYGKRDPVVWMMLGGFGLMAFYSRRHIPFFVICFAIYASECLTIWFSRLVSRPRKVNELTAWVFMAVICSVPIVYSTTCYIGKTRAISQMGSPLSLRVPGDTASLRNRFAYPVGAVEFIQGKGMQGKILSEIYWGGYLAWELFPQCKVAFDTRTETTFPSFVRRAFYDFIIGRPGWQEILRCYPPDMIIVEASGPLPRALNAHPGWREAFSNRVCVMFVPEQWPGAASAFMGE